MATLSQICPNFYNISLQKSENSFDFETDPGKYAQILRDIRLLYEIDFNWKGYHGFNVYYFVETLTDVGYCQTFNLLSANEIFDKNALSSSFFNDTEINEDDSLDRSSKLWSPDSGYTDDAFYKTYPLRSVESNANLGFQAEIAINRKHLTLPCEEGLFGYKILFHNPHDWPRMSENFIQISHNRKYDLVIKPEITITSEALRTYKQEE